jgi:dihydroorotase
MSMDSILIVNAEIVNEGQVRSGDVYVTNGRIERVGADLTFLAANMVIDANGKTLLPGLIDDQVHFREPGLTHKGDIASESRAAVAGGITSFMDMPNTVPPTTTGERLSQKFAAAQGRSFANFSFYLGGANDNIDEIRALDPSACCGIKVFMGSSTGNLLVDDPRALEAIFSQAPTLVAVHCEDDAMIAANARRCRETYGDAVPMTEHPVIRSEEACYRSSARAVELVRRHGTRLHILHLTTARELELFAEGPPDGKRVTAEVCAHHLYFDDSAYPAKGTLVKCNPAIKTAADRRALVAAVAAGRIDVIATDHAPHTLAEKQRPYFQAPAGLPLVQHALLSLLEHVHDGHFSLPLVAEKTAHAPARLFGIRERGYIREGYFADLVLVDLNRPQVVDAAQVLYRCAWTPFEGTVFRSAVDTTLVNGHLAYHNGTVNPMPAGQRLAIESA